MWKNTLGSVLLKGLFFIGVQLCAASAIYAQSSSPIVQWELQILQNGRLVDSFLGATALGQSYTATHRYPLSTKRHCKEQWLEGENERNKAASGNERHKAGELSRTITVMPNYVALPFITFSLEAQETLEAPHTSFSQNCQLLSQPRIINASHPALTVREGSWSSWQILKKNPLLSYRLRARMAKP